MKPVFLRLKFWINDFFHGSKMYKYLKDISFIYNNIDEGEILRKKRLERLLEFATKNIPYYKSLGLNEIQLKTFPIVNKYVYTQYYNQFCTPKNKIPNQKGKLFVSRTSGSTGTPFEVSQDSDCRIRRIATIKFENQLIGYNEFEPLMHLRSLKHYYSGLEGSIIYKPKLNIFYVDNSNLCEATLSEIINTINKNKIKLIRGYMTSLDIITRYMVKKNIELVHKPIFISVGELLQETLRKRIVEDLHCKVVSQYGNEECGIFGKSEINENGSSIILNRANCIIEILKFNSDVCKARWVS